METIHDIKQAATLRTQVIPTLEQMENRMTFRSAPINSNAIEPIVQQQKNKHMKTANLPSAVIGHFKARKHKLNRVAKAVAPSLFSRMLMRAKRAIALLTILLILMLGFILQGVAHQINFINNIRLQ